MLFDGNEVLHQDLPVKPRLIGICLCIQRTIRCVGTSGACDTSIMFVSVAIDLSPVQDNIRFCDSSDGSVECTYPRPLAFREKTLSILQ
jgi:hypothetical protein